MDPVSALGIAAAVVQFVSFAAKILKIAGGGDPASDPSADLKNLHNVHSKLRDLSLRLGSASLAASRALETQEPGTDFSELLAWNSTAGFWDSLLQDSDLDSDAQNEDKLLPLTSSLAPTLRDSYASLSTLLTSCESECSKLIDILATVKSAAKSSSQTWSNISTAVRMLCKKEELAQIEDQLKRLQSLVHLEMGRISM
jgi:hypothetical protein